MITALYEFRCDACHERAQQTGLVNAETLYTAPLTLPDGWKRALGKIYCPTHRLRLVVSRAFNVLELQGNDAA